MLCPSLKSLSISDVPSLVELPSSFQNLYELFELNIKNCVNLETLPNKINLESLWNLDLSGCSRLRTFPDISTNITYLFLNETAIEEVPLWIEEFFCLKVLEMKGCINLETIPNGINLLSLEELDFSGCSRLRTFPDISTNIRRLYLSETATDEVPCWIEKFSKLQELEMKGCNKLNSVSLNIFKVGDLRLVDFSDCKALTEARWSDNPRKNFLSFLERRNISISFNNCSNLDREALFQQRTYLGCQLWLSGEEVPSYFTHRTTGTSSSSLTIPLLTSSLSQTFIRFRACLVFNCNNTLGRTSFLFKGRFWNRFNSFGQAQDFRAKKEVYPMKTSVKGSHLLILEYEISLSRDSDTIAEMNYTHVDLQLDFPSEYKVKEWGIRLCSSADNRLGNPNTLSHVFETDEGKECGGNDEVTEPSSKRMRIS